jgi:chromate transporter
MNGTGQVIRDSAPHQTNPSLAVLAWRFFKIGAIGFGGGMAVIALMERECVRRHRCIEAEEFLHGVGLGQILGPFAVNTALFIGYRKRGVIGGLVAAAAFLLPSVALVIVLSWLYFSYHSIPSLQRALLGVAPVVIALIVSAALAMGRKAVRSWPTLALASLACAGSLLHVNPVWILGGAGAVGLLFRQSALSPNSALSVGTLSGPAISAASVAPAATASTLASVGLAGLTSTFFKIGLIFFGGGFVLVPILHNRLVSQLGWLTPGEFLDGVAISQLTPGPIAVLATFAGYHVAGISGAIVATAALFMPAVLLMLLISHFYERLRHVTAVRDFLAGVVPAVVGLVLAAALALAPGTLSWQRPAGLVLSAVALGLLAWRKWHPAIVLALGAGIGALVPSLLH